METVPEASTSIQYIIFDTDMGSDDAWALQMLLVAERKFKKIKIVGVTCVDGNTQMENVIKSAWRILNANKRCDIPIHAGAIDPLVFIDKYRPTFHGGNGMGDVDYWHDGFPTLKEITHPVKAAQTIRGFCLRYPKNVTLFATGPLTNLALAAKVFPEVRDLVKEIYIMGGNIRGVGNASSAAEFNFFWDPEAAHIVLELFNCKKTILPWETCSPDSISIPLDWRFNVLGKLNGPNVGFLNSVERVIYSNSRPRLYCPCDAFLAAALLFPRCILNQFECFATVEVHGRLTRGQMCVGHMAKHKPSNVTIIESLDAEECKRALIFAADAIEIIIGE